MNKDIQTLIEEASKENHKGSFNSDSIWLQDQSFTAGASFALSLFKWRSFTSELPSIGQRIICKGRKYNFHLSNPISHDSIYIVCLRILLNGCLYLK